MKKALCILFFLPLFVCQAGSVRLLNGESRTGKVTLSGIGVSVVNGNNAPEIFEFRDILVANFKDGAESDLPSISSGVLTTNSWLISGSLPISSGSLSLQLLDALQLKVGKPDHQITVPRAAIAGIIFGPVPSGAIDRVPPGKTGAIIIPTNDFFEGAISGFRQVGKLNYVVVNSPLLGPARLPIPTKAAAIVLRGFQVPSSARYEVIAKDGSRFFCDNPQLESDGILINDPVVGPVKVEKTNMAVIRTGAGHYQPLTDLKPEEVAGASGTSVTVITGGTAGSESAVLTPANAAVSYAVPAGYTVFLCGSALPKEAPPNARVTFAVYCDGKLAFRSVPVGPESKPQNFRVNFGIGKRITLRVEPAPPGAAAAGKWIDPAFLRL